MSSVGALDNWISWCVFQGWFHYHYCLTSQGYQHASALQTGQEVKTADDGLNHNREISSANGSYSYTRNMLPFIYFTWIQRQDKFKNNFLGQEDNDKVGSNTLESLGLWLWHSL